MGNKSKSMFINQVKDCEGLPTLSPPVKEFKLAKIQVNTPITPQKTIE